MLHRSTRGVRLKPHADITDTETVKALSHPLRVQILRMLEELDASLKRIDRIEAASSERLKKANHDGQTRGTVVLALLERLMAPDAPPKNLGKPAPKRSRTRATS